MKAKKIIYFLFLFMWIGVIFTFSLFSTEKSSQQSGTVALFVMKLFSRVGLQKSLSELFIRKASHFIEYAILGGLLFGTLPLLKKPIKENIFKILFFGLLIPVIDESLQIISFRGSSLLDVLLDFCGVLFGVFLLWIIHNFKKAEG